MKFNKVLFIGPDYKDHRGGIGAVLETYAANIPCFKFIPSFKPVGSVGKIIVFFKSLLLISKRLVQDKDIKIVHIHGSHGASVYRKFVIIALAKKIFHKKVIYHLHASSFDKYYSEGNGLYKWLCRSAIKNSDMIIALSPTWYAYYSTTFKPGRIAIVNNIVPLPVNVIKQPDNEVLRLLFLGRIGDRKGIFDLLEVINRNKAEWGGKLELYAGGDGETDRFNDFVSLNGLSGIVKYLGWISASEKRQALSDADILILPSYNEGLPISILEAMSYGLPVLASDVGGIPEVVKNGVNGLTFAPGDLTGIERAINAILEKPAGEIEKMGEKSIEIVADYLPGKVIEQMETIYDSLLIAEKEYIL